MTAGGTLTVQSQVVEAPPTETNGWLAVDVDELIERRERRSVADIFARHGEPYFRAVERAVLFEQLPPRYMVVATGGGTFVDAANRAAINTDGLSVWLDAPLDRIIARMPSDGRRPLAADRSTFERLYQQRRAAYQLAHLAPRRGTRQRRRAGRAGPDWLNVDNRANAPGFNLQECFRPSRSAERNPQSCNVWYCYRAPCIDMRYLVLTDIHANLEALEACLADARARLRSHARARRSRRLRRRSERRDRARGAAQSHAIVRGNHDKVACGARSRGRINTVARSAAH
jgi:shikimate kinase